jgi:hypothetical protein
VSWTTEVDDMRDMRCGTFHVDFTAEASSDADRGRRVDADEAGGSFAGDA